MASIAPSICSRGHPLPAVSSILEAFALKNSNVINIYLVGSHLWSSCQVSSDFDIVIIVKELSSPKPLNYHKGNIEAFILSTDQYIEQIRTHSLQVLVTVWLPKDCILRELFDPRMHFRLFQDTLVSAIEHHKERDLRISQKHFLKGDKEKAKKILLHFIRYLSLAVQITTSGQITDYTAANQYREDVLSNYSNDWAGLMTTVNPILDTLLTVIRV